MFFLVNANINNIMLLIRSIIQSIIDSVSTLRGCIVADIPSMNNMLKILEPIALPNARPLSPFLVATIDVTSSGKDVPIATIVRPMKFWLTPKLDAIIQALSTTRLPPNITAASPPAMKKRLLGRGITLQSSPDDLFFSADIIIHVMYPVIPARRIIPSSLLSFPSINIKHRIAVTMMLKGISRFSISRLVLKPAIKAQIPTTTRPLNMLEPTMLLMAISLLPDIAALMLTEASGALVPIATIVRPIITLGTLRILAREELPSTKKSAPFTKRAKPMSSNKYSINAPFRDKGMEYKKRPLSHQK